MAVASGEIWLNRSFLRKSSRLSSQHLAKNPVRSTDIFLANGVKSETFSSFLRSDKGMNSLGDGIENGGEWKKSIQYSQIVGSNFSTSYPSFSPSRVESNILSDQFYLQHTVQTGSGHRSLSQSFSQKLSPFFESKNNLGNLNNPSPHSTSDLSTKESMADATFKQG